MKKLNEKQIIERIDKMIEGIDFSDYRDEFSANQEIAVIRQKLVSLKYDIIGQENNNIEKGEES